MREFLKKYKTETISVIIFVCIMVFACIYHFGLPKKEVAFDEFQETVTEKSEEKTEEIKETATNKEEKEVVEEGEAPRENDVFTSSEKEEKNSCTVYVSCKTILDNIENLKQGKENLVPKDGIILHIDKAEFEDGETAFEILERELKKKKISLEYKNTQFSGGYYIESIGGIGEFDCGQTSGWLYKVNGEMPNVASSNYILKKGDKIEFLYSCKMGDI